MLNVGQQGVVFPAVMPLVAFLSCHDRWGLAIAGTLRGLLAGVDVTVGILDVP
jgi:hypothetical protein